MSNFKELFFGPGPVDPAMYVFLLLILFGISGLLAYLFEIFTSSNEVENLNNHDEHTNPDEVWMTNEDLLELRTKMAVAEKRRADFLSSQNTLEIETIAPDPWYQRQNKLGHCLRPGCNGALVAGCDQQKCSDYCPKCLTHYHLKPTGETHGK